MGFLDPFTDGLSVGPGGMSRPSKHRRDASRSRRKRSRSRSSSRNRGGYRHNNSSFTGALFGGLGGDSNYHKYNASRGSFFGLGGNNSRSSFFGFGGKPSYYKRSPRQGFMTRAYKRLKRLIRDLIHYAKRHPWKVFFLVIMPLITTGALAGLLARFGLRIPPSLERMMGMASRAASGDSFGAVSDAVRMAGLGGSGSAHVARGRDGGMQWERRSAYGSYGGHDGFGFGRGRRNDDWSDGIMSMAKKFI